MQWHHAASALRRQLPSSATYGDELAVIQLETLSHSSVVQSGSDALDSHRQAPASIIC